MAREATAADPKRSAREVKRDKDGNRVYDKAGANTWVAANRAGFYENQRRRVGDPAFKLKEGDSIVDWMTEVAPAEAPTAKNLRRGEKVTKNEPRNQPDLKYPNGTEKPDADPSDPATLEDSARDTAGADLT